MYAQFRFRFQLKPKILDRTLQIKIEKIPLKSQLIGSPKYCDTIPTIDPKRNKIKHPLQYSLNIQLSILITSNAKYLITSPTRCNILKFLKVFSYLKEICDKDEFPFSRGNLQLFLSFRGVVHLTFLRRMLISHLTTRGRGTQQKIEPLWAEEKIIKSAPGRSNSRK